MIFQSVRPRSKLAQVIVQRSNSLELFYTSFLLCTSTVFFQYSSLTTFPRFSNENLNKTLYSTKQFEILNPRQGHREIRAEGGHILGKQLVLVVPLLNTILSTIFPYRCLDFVPVVFALTCSTIFPILGSTCRCASSTRPCPEAC